MRLWRSVVLSLGVLAAIGGSDVKAPPSDFQSAPSGTIVQPADYVYARYA